MSKRKPYIVDVSVLFTGRLVVDALSSRSAVKKAKDFLEKNDFCDVRQNLKIPNTYVMVWSAKRHDSRSSKL